MNNKFNTNGAVPVILALGLLGCGSNSEDASSDQSTAAQEPSSHVPPATVTGKPAGVFQLYGGDGHGCNQAPAPSACDWFTSFDAVVAGQILTVEPVTAPARLGYGDEDVFVDECNGAIGMALKMTIAVTSVAYSTQTIPSEITVRVGQDTLSNAWRFPSPLLGSGNSVTWYGPYDKQVEAPLFPEAEAVFALSQEPQTGYWILTDEPPISIGGSAQLSFASRDGACGFTKLPTAFESTSLPNFESAAEACSEITTAGAVKRAHRLSAVPEKNFAASCVPDNGGR